MDDDDEPEGARRFWEERYSSSGRTWSGRVNAQLAEVAAGLPPGSALDLGSGEGADALWLAEHGWRVLAVDVSETALRRASQAAAERNLLDRIEFQCHDLNESFPEGTFDLVSAQYLHSPARLDREAVLRRAADHVAPGGVLLIVDHGEAPPWAKERLHRFSGIEEVLAALQLDATWTRLRAERVGRETLGPDGQPATLVDNVMVLRKSAYPGAAVAGPGAAQRVP